MSPAPITVKVIPLPPSRVTTTCLAYPGSPVWWALVGSPVGTRCESMGLCYELAETATDVPVEVDGNVTASETSTLHERASTGTTFECPSKIAAGRADRCGQYSFPVRCTVGQCSMGDRIVPVPSTGATPVNDIASRVAALSDDAARQVWR